MTNVASCPNNNDKWFLVVKWLRETRGRRMNNVRFTYVQSFEKKNRWREIFLDKRRVKNWKLRIDFAILHCCTYCNAYWEVEDISIFTFECQKIINCHDREELRERDLLDRNVWKFDNRDFLVFHSCVRGYTVRQCGGKIKLNARESVYFF